MYNFPKQWPGAQSDPLGPRYSEWSQQMSSQADTPFDHAEEPYRKPIQGSRDLNISMYNIDDFKLIPIIFGGIVGAYYHLDEFAHAFSSSKNAFAIHTVISKGIHDQYNVWIPKQEDKELATLMAKAYLNSLNINQKTGDNNVDLYNLNSSVVDAALPPMLAKLKMDRERLLMIDRVPTPISLPVNVSNKGLDGRSVHDVSSGRFLPLADYFPETDPRKSPFVSAADYLQGW